MSSSSWYSRTDLENGSRDEQQNLAHDEPNDGGKEAWPKVLLTAVTSQSGANDDGWWMWSVWGRE